MATQSIPQGQSKPKTVSTIPANVNVDLTKAKHALNDRVCYITTTSEIARIHPDDLREFRIPTMSCRTFTNEAYRYLKVGRFYVAKEWMEWEQRRTAYSLIYAPGQPRFTSDGNLNTWFAPEIKPKAGDHSQFLEFLSKMFQSDPLYLDWFIASIAYPFQHPGAKLHTASLWWSAKQGNGKSTMGWILRQLYGIHNSTLVKVKSIGGNFNSWAENIQFADMDEMEAQIGKAQADELKSLVTRPLMTINAKYKKPYETRDTINYYFSSNHPNALHLAPDDRRFFVHNVGEGCPLDWLTNFREWLRDPAAQSAILDYLLRVDLKKPIAGGNPFSDAPAPFSPYAPAPRTKSRQEMIDAGRTDIDTWFDEFLESMSADTPTIWGTDDLYEQFQHDNPKPKETKYYFSRHLKPRLRELYKGESIDLGNGTRKRLYLIKGEPETWTSTQLRELYTSQREKLGAASD